MSAAHWQPGDIAECTASGEWGCCRTRGGLRGPMRGETLRVAVVRHLRHPIDGQEVTALGFTAWPGNLYFAEDFRHHVPQPDPPVSAEANWLPLLLNLTHRFKGRR